MRRFVAIATAIVGTLLLAFGLAPRADAATVNYVALGDSYSAGVGAGGTISGGACSRSSNAYPAQWAAGHASSFTFAACSGATTDDVQASQVAALSPATTLVSITIGGNDAGFSDVMQTCVLNSTSTCVARVDTARQYIASTLPARLDSTLATIRSRAPSARVDVLDYPEFYDLSPYFCLGLSRSDHVALNAAADDLAGALSAAAGRAGATFVDVRSRFSGHELCDGGSAWLHSVTYPLGDSYHPTASGQISGYLPAFSAATG